MTDAPIDVNSIEIRQRMFKADCPECKLAAGNSELACVRHGMRPAVEDLVRKLAAAEERHRMQQDRHLALAYDRGEADAVLTMLVIALQEQCPEPARAALQGAREVLGKRHEYFR